MSTLEGVGLPTEHARAQKAACDKAALADEIGACSDSQDPTTGAHGPADLLGHAMVCAASSAGRQCAINFASQGLMQEMTNQLPDGAHVAGIVA